MPRGDVDQVQDVGGYPSNRQLLSTNGRVAPRLALYLGSL